VVVGASVLVVGAAVEVDAVVDRTLPVLADATVVVHVLAVEDAAGVEEVVVDAPLWARPWLLKSAVPPQPTSATVSAAVARASSGRRLALPNIIEDFPTGARRPYRRSRRPWSGWLWVIVSALVVTACGGGTSHGANGTPVTSSSATTSTSTSTTTEAPTTTTSTTTSTSRTTTPSTTTPRSTTTTTAAPGFSSEVAGVTPAEVSHTWHPGCPVGPAQLRLLTLRYWGFDHRAHLGTMVVNAAVTSSVIRVFHALYDERFPIAEMIPENTYHGNDNAAAAADDTSGFNCRYAVAPGPPQWSVHAYGEAIDVNDVQNPYVDGTTIIPPSGAKYLNRSHYRPGMAVPGGELVDAFASVGWLWGGRWASTPDYQHFSLTGG